MYQNYSNRVKNFIIDMINPETQVTINDSTNNKNSNEVTNKDKDMFIQKKPFIFKGYTNEKERIIEHIKNNQYLNGIYEYDNEKKIKENKENPKNKLLKYAIKSNRLKITSPLSKMNFNNKNPSIDKPINLSQSNNISVIKNKLFPGKLTTKYNLKSLFNSKDSKNKLIIRKIKSLSKENTHNKDAQKNSIKNKELNQISQYISKTKNMNKRKTLKKEFKSKENHEIFNSYNNKLHFKAAEEIAENKMNKYNKSLLLLPNLFQKNKSKEKNNKLNYEEKQENKTEEDSESESSNSFYYNNPYHDIKKRTKYNPNLMKQLSKIAFEEDKTKKFFEQESKKNISINQTYDKRIKKLNIKDENEVEIDGEIFEKTTQFNLITKKVLQICKVYNNKGKKSKKIVKAGDGKNMMTKGMSVNNFIRKYKLKY